MRPGFWHFNNELNADAAFEAKMEEFWTVWQAKTNDFANPLVWWDKAKHSLRLLQSVVLRLEVKQKKIYIYGIYIGLYPEAQSALQHFVGDFTRLLIYRCKLQPRSSQSY